ncbi:MAG: adenosylcobinamide-GDP ribazoletransferase [Oscillospiraceae bacterium]|nr:adenosylcobinamide-GDP ribazoletransferase [Oscillospiraceae bacterium]
MYSRIPAPQVEWSEENRRYALCFFPVIGAVIGGMLLGWRVLCTVFAIGAPVFAAVAMLLPLLVTGGIHMDGFLDVTDARASCAQRERRLEILHDPHIGSFAVIWGAALLILQTALLTQLTDLRSTGVVAVGFILSRALSGLTAVLLPAARHDGSLQSFVRPAHKRTTVTVLLLTATASAAAMLVLSPLQGTLSVLASGVVLVYYRRSTARIFGGVTGDTQGWFLQLCETAVLLSGLL